MADDGIVDRIRSKARAVIREHPEGIRYSRLKSEVLRAFPNLNPLTVGGQLPRLPTEYPNEISKPERGLFIPVGVTSVLESVPQRCEADLYAPFAEWLRNDLEEVTEAVELGGSAMRGKWGTPDVVGVLRPKSSDLVKFQPEIVAAELKSDPTQSVVAFGQAVAYLLFASKSYVVMPDSIAGEDLIRLESLCVLFGVGLCVYGADRSELEFRPRVRAQRHVPDMYYVNEFAERLKAYSIDKFETIFG